jgi:alkylation response protein AidB-like acyl-CoA dehydrogenase
MAYQPGSAPARHCGPGMTQAPGLRYAISHPARCPAAGGAGDESVVPELSNIKVAIGRSVIAATQAAVAALGNPGLTRRNSLERYLRDALCVRVHPPQEDTVLLASGRRVLGV